MKILCTVRNKPAVVVGYAPGRKGRPMAIIISEGKLASVRLKDIVLSRDQEKIEPLRRKEG